MIIIDQLISMPALYSVLIISFVVSLFINIVYKFMTDQKRLKEIREEIKLHQKRMKELRDDPKKLMEVQKDAMKIQMEMFTQTMRSTFITIIPLLLLFAWMNAHFAYAPIKPGQDFTTTMLFKEDTSGSPEIIVPEGIKITGSAVVDINDNHEAVWNLKGEEGEYLLQYKFEALSFDKEVLITQNSDYKAPVKNINQNDVEQISISHDKNILLNIRNFKIGWLGTYIIFSLIFSMVLRKIMGLY